MEDPKVPDKVREGLALLGVTNKDGQDAAWFLVGSAILDVVTGMAMEVQQSRARVQPCLN